jgi:hypothetical protein
MDETMDVMQDMAGDSVAAPKAKPRAKSNGGASSSRPKAAQNDAGKSSEIADSKGQIAAINKAFAVIEFALDGKILRANDNFLNAVGYLPRIRAGSRQVVVLASSAR